MPTSSLTHPTQKSVTVTFQNRTFAFRSLHYGILYLTEIKWIYLLYAYELYLNKVPQYNGDCPPKGKIETLAL